MGILTRKIKIGVSTIHWKLALTYKMFMGLNVPLQINWKSPKWVVEGILYHVIEMIFVVINILKTVRQL